MKIKINNIKIGDRIREELGDISGLQNSIETYGLFNPVIINQHNELLAGARRLNACRNLDWEEIEVTVIKTDNDYTKLEIESHENFMRKDFNEKEVEKVIDKKKKLANRSFFYMLNLTIKHFFAFISRIWNRVFGTKNSNPQINDNP